MNRSLTKFIDATRLNPYRDMNQMQDSFDRLFTNFMTLRRTNGAQDFNFSPSCEVTEDVNSYMMKFDLPGVSKDQVKVEIDHNQITVSAERKEETKHESKKKYLSELSYGSYTRSFQLPGPIDEKKVDAKFENGVLSLTVPKVETAKAKKIAVHI